MFIKDNNFIETKKSDPKMNKKGLSTELIIGIIALVIVAILFILSIFVQLPYTKSEAYVDKVASEEHYTESVPYTDQDCNYVNMIYKITWGGTQKTCLQQDCASYNQICASYNWLGNCNSYKPQCASYECIKYNNHCELDVENKESTGMTLPIKLQKWIYDSNSAADISGYDSSYWINPLDTITIKWDYSLLPTESSNCYYSVTDNPQRQQCKDVIRYKDEDRTRTVYNDVTKYRDVTKYCSALNKIMNKCS